MGSQEIREGTLIAGKYRVRAVLGKARGVLAEALHEEADQRVALQVLSADEYDVKEVERFRREARALAKLESEHAARILDVGTEPDGSFYLARQFLEGDDLASWAKKRGKVPVDEAVLLVLQAAEAVAEAHGYGILLRELMPSHLFVTRRAGGGPVIKIIDFGTAKLMRDPRLSDDITAAGVLGLTPYASPEMVRRSSSIDQRTDVWSLGVILYELLAGRPPFSGDDAELMLQIMKTRAAPIAAARGDVPRQLDDVLGWALAKDLTERFRDMHAFAHALRPFAPPEGLLTIDRIAQIAKQAKRRRQEANEEARKKTQDAATTAARVEVREPAAPAPPVEAPLKITRPVIADEDSVTRLEPLVAPRRERPETAVAATGPVKAVSKSGRPAPLFAGAAADIEMELHSVPASSRRGGDAGASAAIPSAPRVPSFDGARRDQPIDVAPAARVAAAPAPALPSARRSDPPRAAQPAPPVHRSDPPRALQPAPPVHRSDPPRAAPVSYPPQRPSFRPMPPPQLALVRPDPGPSKLVLIAAAVICATVPAVLAILLLGKKAPAPPSPSVDQASSQQAVAEPPPPSTERDGSSSSTPVPLEPEPAPSGSTAAAPIVGDKRPATRGAEPQPGAKPSAEPGTLIAVAVGGTCAFSVNGVAKGTGTTVKVPLKPGSYTVTCKPTTGGAKSRSVVIPSGGTAMATFKLP